MRNISPEVIRIIYGPSFAYSKILLLFGIPIAAAALQRPPSNNYFDPLILLLVPAWFFYIYVNIFTLLRKPRTSNFAFILGIDYHYRRTAANIYIKRKLIESLFSVIPCIVVFLPIRLITVSLEANNDTYFICLGVCMEYFCMVVFFKFLRRYSLIKPEKHDSNGFQLPRCVSDVHKFISCKILSSTNHSIFKTCTDTQKHLLFWKISSFGLWGFNRTCKALIRRQWLYLFRYEWMSFSAIFSVCLLSGIYLCGKIPSESNTLSILVLLLFPVTVFLFTTRTFSESALMIRCCPYYNVTKRDFFTANIVISASLVLPYMLLIVIRIWIFHYPLVNVVPVFLSFFALVYLHSCLSMYPELTILGIFQSGVLGISVFSALMLAENNVLYSFGFACIPILFIFITNKAFSSSIFTS